MIVVSDTSPLNYLILVGAEHVLPLVFDTVLAPPAVLLEMQHPKAPEKVRQWAATPPAWLQERSPESIMPFDHLGAGELEAIALAVQVRADKLLIDDREGLEIARGLGLSCFGTLAVLDLAAEMRLLDLPAVITELRKTSFHVAQNLIERLMERDGARKRKSVEPDT